MVLRMCWKESGAKLDWKKGSAKCRWDVTEKSSDKKGWVVRGAETRHCFDGVTGEKHDGFLMYLGGLPCLPQEGHDACIVTSAS